MRTRESAQGVVEAALVLPALVFGLLLLVGLGLLGQANAGVQSVAGEAARAAALANTPLQADAEGRARAAAVASGYALDPARLQVSIDTSGFARGGRVRASIDYRLPLGQLVPLVWGDVPLHHEAVEPVDRFRTFQ